MAELSTLSPLSTLFPLSALSLLSTLSSLSPSIPSISLYLPLSHLYTCMLSAAEGRKFTPYQHICNSTNPTISNRYPHTALFLPLHILKCR